MGTDTKNVVPLPAKNMVQLEFAELNRVYCGKAFETLPEIVITSEARNLLLSGPGATGGEQQIPHRLKSVRDDNSKITCLSGTLGRSRSWKARTPWPPACARLSRRVARLPSVLEFASQCSCWRLAQRHCRRLCRSAA